MNLVNILNLEPDYIKDNSEEYFNEGISNLLDGYFHSNDLLYNFSKSYFATYQESHKKFLEKLLNLVTEKIRDNKHSYLNDNLFDNEKINKKVLAISTLKYDIIPSSFIFWIKNNSKSIYRIHKAKIDHIINKINTLSKTNTTTKYKLQFDPDMISDDIISNIDVVLAFRACYDMKLYKEDKYPLAKKGMFLTHLPDFTKVTHSDEIEPILISKYLKKYGERKTYTIKEILDIIKSMNEDYETLFAKFYDFISDLDNDFTTYMKSTVVYNQSVDKNTVDKRYILLYRTMVNDYVKVIMVYGAIYQYLMKHFLYFIEDIELQADYLEEKMK